MENMDAAGLGTLAMLWYGASFLLWLGLDVALLVIALAVVRKKRPDAAGPLIAAAALMLSVTLISPVVGLFGSRFLALSSYGAVQVVLTGAQAVVRALGFGLVLSAIVRLAEPARIELPH